VQIPPKNRIFQKNAEIMLQNQENSFLYYSYNEYQRHGKGACIAGSAKKACGAGRACLGFV
jgi:hypothetical protein